MRRRTATTQTTIISTRRVYFPMLVTVEEGCTWVPSSMALRKQVPVGIHKGSNPAKKYSMFLPYGFIGRELGDSLEVDLMLLRHM